MNYEQKYNEVLQKAKEEYNRLGELGNESMKRRFEIIFPELAESEDERIRNLIYCLIRDRSDNQKLLEHNGVSVDEALAYLEKQKEQKQISNIIAKAFENSKTDYSLEEREKSSDYSERVLPTSITYGEDEDEYRLHKVIEAAYIAGQKEQKPIQPNLEREYIEERLRGLIDKEGEYYRGAREELAHLFYTLGGQPSQYLINNVAKEEQKHVDEPFETWIDGWYNEHHRDGYITMDEREFKNFCRGIRNIDQQKPAEWNEEEMKVLDSIIDDYEKAAKSFCGYDGKIGLLKAIRDGEYDLPKQEWSEEDEENLDKLHRLLIICQGEKKFIPTSEYDKLDNWLKSLPYRFSLSSWGEEIRDAFFGVERNWKPSEDEERLIKTSISFLKDFADKGYENAVECIDWLKSKLNGNSGK